MVKDNSISKVMVIFLGVTLLASSFTAYSGSVFAAAPGTFIDDFVSSGSGGLDVPKNLAFGPDGNLYVSSFPQDKIKRYDGITGAYIDTFVPSGSGGLDGPQGLVFGPDDNLYVTSEWTNEVLRYDGTTGAFMDVFVSGGGLSNPQESIFGPDGNLYVSNYFADTVVRFDGISGAFMDVFVTAGSGGLDKAQGLEFGPDGNLYVASENTDEILRFNGATGAFIDIFATPSGMMHNVKDLTFGPDGNLYATDNQHSHVERYDGTTGVKIDRYVSGGDGILNSPQGLVFGPDDNLYVTSQNTDEILRYEGPFGIGGDCDGHPATIVGTNGDDVIVGTSGDDVILGLDGDDNINGNGGNDIICSGFGNDVVTTGSGNDEIHGEGGFDTFDAGDGVNLIDADFGIEGDTVTTGSGDDHILLGDGDDIVNAGDGVNYIETGGGDDTITSGSGNDEIYGNNGDDVINSGNGNDQVYGGNGMDTIDAGDGNNYVEGNHDDDEIWTGAGDDTIFGGNGDDCINSGGEPGDIIDGGSGTNLINTGSCTSIPTITINSPANGANFVDGDLITLDGSAMDPEDGGLSNNIIWTSDIHGGIGTGSPISSSAAPVGIHTITATVTDSDGNSVSQSISITVNAIGTPTLIITEPANSFLAVDGTSITFSASAVDPEDGGLSNLISWTSDMDGFMSVGDSFSMSTLSIGTHTITATVTDADGNSVSQSIIITINAIVEEASTLICHYPPGNPDNFHEIMIAPSALLAHKAHDDKLGQCEDADEKRLELIKIKKHREETRDKNELKEKRSELKEIKKNLNEFKKEFNGIEKQKIKNLVDEIKEVIKKLNENPKYDREFKQILKDEIKETKLKIKQEMTTKEKTVKHKIDSKIHSLSKSDNPQRDAKKLGFDFKDGKTKIVIKLSDDTPEIVDYLNSFGTVDVKNGKHVQLTVNVNDLPKLSSIEGVDKIRPPFSAVQFYEELSEGVYFINADLAQFAGITGEGIKAAVLDLAFTDNEKISDNIVQVKSFRQGIGYMPIQGTNGEASHGTAVAEIITDVAPDVELYLYSMETDIEFITAVDEAISQQVDIIAMSAGWPNFPTDGTSHITQKIEEAVENGIVFVVPSGNFAEKHWEGSYVDSNFNNWQEYNDSDEGLSIAVTKERITEEKPIVSYLMWDVGMADVADFEMVLVDPLGQIVDYSANEQKTKSDTPFEYIHHIPDTEGTYSIGVLYAGDMSEISKRPKASLEIFSVYDELEHAVSQSSVSVPADAEGAIVVGAVNHLDGTLEPFSSQGPTNNGKLAPHVVGPDGVTTLALGKDPFYGTSATTPYIAGLAALILQSNPDMSPQQVLNEIQENTDQSMFSLENEYDYSLGYGSANAFFLVEDSEVMG